MLSKNKRPYDPELLQPEQRARANMQDLFANNAISGHRAQELINDFAAAGARGLRRLTGKRGKRHAARDLRRGFLRNTQWPDLYWAQIRVYNKRTHKEETQWLAFLLPHEILEALARLAADKELLYNRAGLDDVGRAHLESACASAGCNLVGLGLWGDGVPCNWDRSESVEVFSLNLPGQDGEYKPLRIPITALSRKQVSTHTWDDILAVVHWSLVQCASGQWPAARHDGRPWRQSDKKRVRKAGQSLGVRAALVEVRGDWKMFGEVFHLPKWNTNAGCCWRCPCTPDQVTDPFGGVGKWAGPSGRARGARG